jgi:hypothetical protein
MWDNGHQNAEHFGVSQLQKENKIIPATEHAILYFELKCDI